MERDCIKSSHLLNNIPKPGDNKERSQAAIG